MFQRSETRFVEDGGFATLQRVSVIVVDCPHTLAAIAHIHAKSTEENFIDYFAELSLCGYRFSRGALSEVSGLVYVLVTNTAAPKTKLCSWQCEEKIFSSENSIRVYSDGESTS